MKITRVECLPISTPMRKPMVMPNTRITQIDSLLVKIHTDAGIVGVADSGDTSSWYRGEMQETMATMIADVIAPKILIGEDPRNIERIVGRMDLLVRDNNQAKATIDFALHDLKGKIMEVPVYQLLGGRTVEAADMGWVLSSDVPAKVVAEAHEALKQGFKLLKMKTGHGTLDDDIEMVAAVRKAVGDSVRLSIDANGFWTYEQALRTIRVLDRYDLELIEQPLPHWDIEGMARLRQQVRTPIYADESAQELHHLKEIIDRRAADGLFIKTQKAGGLVRSKRWLTMARLSGLPVMCGCMIGSGLETSPAAHLWVSDQWASQYLNESTGPLTIHGVWNTADIPAGADLALNVPRMERARLYPNEGPGFGIELNEDFIERNATPGKARRVVGV
ncbi:MAG: mandelate racemase [Burkholderiales bacterium]|nr:mandelate racemase [Burkholderiales bacterium]